MTRRAATRYVCQIAHSLVRAKALRHRGLTGSTQAALVTTLNALGATDTDAEAINNRGEVVGTYVVEPTATEHGFVYDDGTFTTLDVPGANDTRALALNNRGEAAGGYIENREDCGFVYDNGTYTTLSVAGASTIFVEAINDRGEVVRSYIENGKDFGFVYVPRAPRTPPSLQSMTVARSQDTTSTAAAITTSSMTTVRTPR